MSIRLFDAQRRRHERAELADIKIDGRTLEGWVEKSAEYMSHRQNR